VPKPKPKYLILYEKEVANMDNAQLLEEFCERHADVINDTYWPSTRDYNLYNACLDEMEIRLELKKRGES
jgi:hypothetical protein